MEQLPNERNFGRQREGEEVVGNPGRDDVSWYNERLRTGDLRGSGSFEMND